MRTDFLTDGGQTAASVAGLLAGFLGQAQHSIEMAIYDLVLEGAAEEAVAGALGAAIARGVRVRLAYNLDHPRAVPVPPPPKLGVLGSPGIRELPGLEHHSIPGVPDLMHHKFVVVDGLHLWTGSTNWTNDSWTREENIILRLDSAALAAQYLADFEELWEKRDVASSGHVKPEWFELGGGVRARAFFTPWRAEKLVAELSQSVAAASRRVRICSPVMTSGPLLGTLTDIIQRGTSLDIRGVFDGTQMSEVRHQWQSNGAAQWKLQALAAILKAIPFTAKHSTPWAPHSVHDFMHAKCVVADDHVFLGSYNLSRSGEMNAENVLEIESPELADTCVAFVDSVIARYPPALAVGGAGPSPHIE
ncbi:MAG TPA: phospholipase D-like domain-containing protein [Candidatus Dormibacteraeota bacterium]